MVNYIPIQLVSKLIKNYGRRKLEFYSSFPFLSSSKTSQSTKYMQFFEEKYKIKLFFLGFKVFIFNLLFLSLALVDIFYSLRI